MGDDTKLSPADEALLRHLRQEVDYYQDESLRTQFRHPNVNQDWDRARRELKEFVTKLRIAGKNV
jgi:hypothetical protein